MDKPVAPRPPRRLPFSLTSSHFRLLLLALPALTWVLLIPPSELIQSLPLRRRSSLISFGLPCLTALLAFTVFQLVRFRKKSVYLLDFVCYRAADERKLSKEGFMLKSRLTKRFTEESLEFQKKILQRSGIGQETYFPPAVTNVPPNPCLEEARREAEVVMFSILDELFAKSHVKPRDVGILVVNCSVFCPTPSLCTMIINRYKMRDNILSYNLGGMGCSAGVIAVALAKDLLQVHSSTHVVVLSTENITLNWYRGNDKTMLVSNCLFRMGGCAALLSNMHCDRKRAKYELLHTVRTHKAAEDKCFWCVQQQDDPFGISGVFLSRELMAVAGNALRTNITTLGPLVLPLQEQLQFVASVVGRKLLKLSLKPYVPNFKLAFEHFCIHAGGRAVLDEVESSLNLSDWHMEPNRMTLYRFGNTSSSSLWYELAYIEAKGRVRRGDRVWQIGFGSGFKCNSAVWRSLKDIEASSVSNCWSEFINKFPVQVPAVEKF